MKKLIGLLFCLCCFNALQAQYTIPDANFATKLQVIVPNAMNGNVLDETHPDVTTLTELDVTFNGIQDLDGVQFFTSLEHLACSHNNLTSLPELPSSLVRLSCFQNALTSLPELPSSLEILICYSNGLTSLPELPMALQYLDCRNSQLTSLPELPSSLDELRCRENALTSLPELPSSLAYLDCSFNALTSLPELPSTLETLICKFNNLGSLTELPSSLEDLDCSGIALAVLPELPSSLEELLCSQNALTSLPELPASLRILTCSYNALTSLPELPSSLVYLTCSQNALTSLPELPSSLEDLGCSGNALISLPELPSSLEELWCSYNVLTSLPDLPVYLKELWCYGNALTSLPELPSSLEQLRCYDNPLVCLSPLPNTLRELDCYNSDISCLPNVPAEFIASSSNLGFPLTVCNVANTPCPLSQEAITGSVFHDDNGNGVKDGGEGPFLLANIEAQPGGYLTTTDASGNYVLPIAEGTFTLDGQEVIYHTKTTSSVNITLGPLEVDSLNHIGYQVIPGIYDLVAEITAQLARPGFDNTLWLQVQNIGTESTTANIDLDFDTDQTWVGSTEVPVTQVGNHATWSPVLAPGDSWSTTVTLHTDVSVPLGTAITHTLTALPQQPDEAPANNTATVNTVVVGSYDPNDKLIEPAFLSEVDVQAGAMIDYTIRFQNTGTFLAERVVITDTLSADLEWSTMDFVSSSHENTWYIQDGVLHFIFDDIFLPDSNANEPESHGFVKFRMQPKTTLSEGAQIENVANIYFDFNDPVITDPAIFTVGEPYIELALIAFLGGPFDDATNLMHDSLRNNGLVPTTEPYTGMGYSPVGPQEATIDPSVLTATGNDAIVDWVLVELREALAPANIVRSRYALIQRDGDVVDVDGASPVLFENIDPSSYHVLIWHRNHLAAMSAGPLLFADGPLHLDITGATTGTWGTDGQQNINGSMTLWPGNVTPNSQVKYVGSANDRDPILVEIGGLVPTATTTGYKLEDVNMDGVVKYTGSSNDRDPILETIGGTLPTAVKNEQVP